MKRLYSRMAAVLCALLIVTACNPLADWEDNPAQVRTKAEIAGGATVYAYFAIDKAAVKHAAGLREVVTVIKDVATGFPEAGFVALLPTVNEELQRRLVGEKAVYLLPARLLAQVLLEALQTKAETDHWLDSKDAVSDIISAFLSGADTALASYIPPDMT